MTFALENLTEDQSSEIAKRLSKFQTILSSPLYQIVDQARNLIFLDLGGRGSYPAERGEPPTHYALISHDHVVAFEANDRTESTDDGLVVHVDVQAIRVPSACIADIDILLQAIRDAMSVNWKHRTGQSVPVEVSFPQISHI